jgi:hypothetical protein
VILGQVSFFICIEIITTLNSNQSWKATFSGKDWMSEPRVSLDELRKGMGGYSKEDLARARAWIANEVRKRFPEANFRVKEQSLEEAFRKVRLSPPDELHIGVLDDDDPDQDIRQQVTDVAKMIVGYFDLPLIEDSLDLDPYHTRRRIRDLFQGTDLPKPQREFNNAAFLGRLRGNAVFDASSGVDMVAFIFSEYLKKQPWAQSKEVYSAYQVFVQAVNQVPNSDRTYGYDDLPVQAKLKLSHDLERTLPGFIVAFEKLLLAIAKARGIQV